MTLPALKAQGGFFFQPVTLRRSQESVSVQKRGASSERGGPDGSHYGCVL